MRRKTILLLLLILLLASGLRFYKLGKIPVGLTNDEANIGYDAYSITKTGADQWGEKYPLVAFRGFGDYRLPVYTYLTIPSIMIFNLTALAVRFPSALIGVFTVLITFLFSQYLFNTFIGLTASFLLAISPWHIGMSRIGIESNLAIFLVVLGIYFFYLGLRKTKFLWPSFIVLTISLYTYYSVRVFLPLLMLILIYSERKYFWKIRARFLKILLICFFLCLPILISMFKDSGQARIKHLVLTKDVGTILKINEKRGECLKQLNPTICRLTYNKATTFFPKIISNYLNHYSLNLYFIDGSSTSKAILPTRGLLYLFEFPFLLIGLIILILKKSSPRTLLLSWILLAPLADSLTGPEHFSRMLILLPSLQIIIAYGLYQFYCWLKGSYRYLLGKLFLFIFILVVGFSVYGFTIDYFIYFPAFFAEFSHYGYQETFTYLYSIKNNYQNIYFSTQYHDTKHYIFYLFFNRYDPRLYQNSPSVISSQKADGWIKVSRVDNLYFVDLLPTVDDLSDNDLLIADSKEIPHGLKPIKIIKDLQNNILFEVVEARTLKDYIKATNKQTDNRQQSN